MRLANISNLGLKELRGLARDPILLVLIVYAFTLSIYTAATAMPETLHRRRGPVSGFLAHRHSLLPARLIDHSEMDARMDAGPDTFALNIPPNFQRDLLAGRSPAIQLNVDATRMSQAFTGGGYVQSIVSGEVSEFVNRHRATPDVPVDLVLRARLNPPLDQGWFGAISNVITPITMLAIVLTGAALIREKEHGTIDHLLVMPVTPAEIMIGKVLSTGLVVLAASAISLLFIVQGLLGVPIHSSIALFLAGAALHLFATTSLGLFLAIMAGSMPQFGLLLMLVLLPLQVLSGGMTPRESMPDIIQTIMLAAPNTHFVILAQAILFRGAGLSVVWPQFLALIAIGAALFALSLSTFPAVVEIGLQRQAAGSANGNIKTNVQFLGRFPDRLNCCACLEKKPLTTPCREASKLNQPIVFLLP